MSLQSVAAVIVDCPWRSGERGMQVATQICRSRALESKCEVRDLRSRPASEGPAKRNSEVSWGHPAPQLVARKEICYESSPATKLGRRILHDEINTAARVRSGHVSSVYGQRSRLG